MNYKKKPCVERFCIYCKNRFTEPRSGTYTCEACRDVLSYRQKERFCTVCGNSFFAEKKTDKYCVMHAEDGDSELIDNAKKAKKNKSSIPIEKKKTNAQLRRERTKIAKEAWDKEKMSYGQYVAKYGL